MLFNIGLNCSQREIHGVWIYRSSSLSAVAGHRRWSCDVVAMVKGGWDVVWLLRVAS